MAVVAGSAATTAATCGRLLVAAQRDAVGATGALDRAEALRAGPRGDGADVVSGSGILFDRRWTTTAGRGDADALAVVVDWGGHGIALATAAFP